MASNEIQGMVFWEPFPYRAVKEQGARIVHSGTTSYFAKNKGEAAPVSNNRTIWVASQDWVRKNPNAANALVKVLLKGAEIEEADLESYLRQMEEATTHADQKRVLRAALTKRTSRMLVKAKGKQGKTLDSARVTAEAIRAAARQRPQAEPEQHRPRHQELRQAQLEHAAAGRRGLIVCRSFTTR